MCCKIHEGRREHFSVLKTWIEIISLFSKLLTCRVSGALCLSYSSSCQHFSAFSYNKRNLSLFVRTETGNADRSMSMNSSVAET